MQDYNIMMNVLILYYDYGGCERDVVHRRNGGVTLKSVLRNRGL